MVGLAYSEGMELHERIRSARRAKGLTQKAIADHFSIRPVSVTQWESGKSAPEIEKLPRLAKLLDVPLPWLMDEDGSPHLSSEEIAIGGQDVRSEGTGQNRPPAKAK